MIVRERLAERIATLSLTQSEVARRVGVSQATVAQLLTGRSSSTKHLPAFARELGTTVEYLEGVTADPHTGALPTPTPEVIADQLDLVPIDEVSLEYGMGATFVTDDANVDVVTRYFPRAWLRLFTQAPPSKLSFARGRGDSMMPTMLDGDLVLIDRTDRHPREQDRVWALVYGDFGAIKRLRSLGGGTMKIMSDNITTSDEIVTAEELTIVGRVVWIGRKM